MLLRSLNHGGIDLFSTVSSLLHGSLEAALVCSRWCLLSWSNFCSSDHLISGLINNRCLLIEDLCHFGLWCDRRTHRHIPFEPRAFRIKRRQLLLVGLLLEQKLTRLHTLVVSLSLRL